MQIFFNQKEYLFWQWSVNSTLENMLDYLKTKILAYTLQNMNFNEPNHGFVTNDVLDVLHGENVKGWGFSSNIHGWCIEWLSMEKKVLKKLLLRFSWPRMNFLVDGWVSMSTRVWLTSCIHKKSSRGWKKASVAGNKTISDTWLIKIESKCFG